MRVRTTFLVTSTTGWLLLAAGLGACRSAVEASVTPSGATKADSTREPMVRTFAIDALAGLHVDAASSGLGLDFAIPRDASTTREFQLKVTLDAREGDGALYLALASDEIQSLERPSTLELPTSMLPERASGAALAVAVRDASGVRRILAPEATRLADDRLAVTTSQPMGEWSLVDANGSDASYVAVAAAGLAPDESLRYAVAFVQQHVVESGFEIRLADHVVNQKITGEESRYVSAPVGADGRYVVTILEAPVRKSCVPSPESGTTTGRATVQIVCTAR